MDNKKAPDLCLNVNPDQIAQIIEASTNSNLMIKILRNSIWSDPLPVECKSRRGKGDRQLRSALQQLVSYWKHVHDMAGYGIYAQIDIVPETVIKLHFLLPKISEINNVRKIILGDVAGTSLVTLSEDFDIEIYELASKYEEEKSVLPEPRLLFDIPASSPQWKYSISKDAKINSNLRLGIRGFNEFNILPALHQIYNLNFNNNLNNWIIKEINSNYDEKHSDLDFISISAHHNLISADASLSVDRWGLLSGTVIVEEEYLIDSLNAIHILICKLGDFIWK